MYLILDFVHKLLSETVQPSDVCVDATCGNGNDTIHLAGLVGPGGKVYAFDIQEEAINHTKALCKEFKNIIYILDSHEYINNYISEQIKAVVFNLGYLPKGNKEITTTSSTTLKTIESLLPRVISESLMIIIVVYPGHPEGKKESETLQSFLRDLDKHQYLITKYENFNWDLSPYVLTISQTKRR